MNQTEAYHANYDTSGMTSKQVWEEASKLASHPKVAQRIRELSAARAAYVAETRAWDLDRLVDEAETNMAGAREDHQWSAANGSLTTIGKATGLLIDKVDVDVTHTLKPGLSLEELEARFHRLDALESGVVEGQAVVLDD